jgi:hypothetical protein
LNWYITTDDAASLPTTDPTIDRSDDDDPAFEPDQVLVDAARSAAESLAGYYQGQTLITIQAHEEQATPEVFKPGFISVTVSLTDPTAPSL